MTHAREQIRDAVKAAVTGLPSTGNRVFASRVHPINDNELPCLLVFTRMESSAPLTIGFPRRMERTLAVLVEGYVKMTTGYDDKLDMIASEVEEAVQNDSSLSALVKDMFFAGCEIKLVGEAEKPVALISMEFTARYHTRENDPETII